jgi:hypothetical protein
VLSEPKPTRSGAAQRAKISSSSAQKSNFIKEDGSTGKLAFGLLSEVAGAIRRACWCPSLQLQLRQLISKEFLKIQGR